MECGREQPAKDLGEEAQEDVTKTQQGPGEHPAEEAGRSLVSSPVRNERRRGLCSATCKVAASPPPSLKNSSSPPSSAQRTHSSWDTGGQRLRCKSGGRKPGMPRNRNLCP